MRYIRRVIVIAFVAVAAVYLVTTIAVSRKQDKTAPVITCEVDELEVSSGASEEELLKGLKATDNKDGDITDKIRVGSHSKFIDQGVCDVTYLVFDSSYNAGQYTRRVRYTDYTSPKFSLTASLVYDLASEVTILNKLQASDAIDGDINEKIKIISSNVNVEKEGTYSIGVEVVNDYADVVSLELPVHIVDIDDNAPSIQLDTYLVYVDKGGAFNPAEHLQGAAAADGTAIDPGAVAITSSVDTSKAGTYEAAYQCTDGAGRTGYSYLIVVVTE